MSAHTSLGAQMSAHTSAHASLGAHTSAHMSANTSFGAQTSAHTSGHASSGAHTSAHTSPHTSFGAHTSTHRSTHTSSGAHTSAHTSARICVFLPWDPTSLIWLQLNNNKFSILRNRLEVMLFLCELQDHGTLQKTALGHYVEKPRGYHGEWNP